MRYISTSGGHLYRKLNGYWLDSGRDARGLLLYISLFKLRFDQREEASNPIVGVKKQLQDFKQFILQETAHVSTY